MLKEIIATGKTVDEAIDTACAELSVAREDVEFEILELPKKKLFKTTPYKVRVYFEAPDEVAYSQPKPEVKENKKENKKAEKEAKKEIKKENKKDTSAPVSEKAEVAVDFLKKVLSSLELADAEINVSENENGADIALEGEHLGIIIGRRGETLDALQYLTGLVANKSGGDYFRISLDSGNYREKREKTLEALAIKMATQSVKTGKSHTLEPMNPYERRIIHAAVQNVEGAVSSSVGDEPNRRVLISSKNARRYSDRRGGYKKGGYNKKPYNRDNNRPQRAPKSDLDLFEKTNDSEAMPLYSKINIDE